MSCCLSLALANNPWEYNSPEYASEQYASIFGSADNGLFGPLQYQYVDYLPNCSPGGQPICATDGKTYSYFENACRLEAHNMKLLFQQGTELEPTELENCLPKCDRIQCTKRHAPVCAVASDRVGEAQDGMTFGNECELRKYECNVKKPMQILNQGPCAQKLKVKKIKKMRQRYSKVRRVKTTTTTTSTTTPKIPLTTKDKKQRPYMLVDSLPETTTTATPLQFRQIAGVSSPDVSVSRAVTAYNVYNIPDVGQNYASITDSSLSVYVPGVGAVTDEYPTTRALERMSPTTTLTTEPLTSSSTAAPTSSTSPYLRPGHITEDYTTSYKSTPFFQSSTTESRGTTPASTIESTAYVASSTTKAPLYTTLALDLATTTVEPMTTANTDKIAQ
ncbi:mucin-5AC [Scaptodrosophila lebanonensis]|uniref:Mucin-5AC n=1 Tax=Drosophila lebanonensis TaxID=7225 RepID=A0A6J2U395_DROLE|nr:mucin-5AC [Scaptodrosophila lebanonensis]